MKKKNGFTLIELLAVIVILAIIALIAVPVVMNIINKANKSAFKDSAYGLIKAGELFYTSELLENAGLHEVKTFTFPNNTDGLEIKGSKPSGGYVTVNKKGQVSMAVTNGKYCVTKDFEDEDVTIIDGNCGTSNEEDMIGKPVYYNPNEGLLCTKTDWINNYDKNGKSGCMRWYIYGEEGNKQKLILDHNTTAEVAWNSTGENLDDYVTLREQLEIDTANWKVSADIVDAFDLIKLISYFQELEDINGWQSQEIFDEYWTLYERDFNNSMANVSQSNYQTVNEYVDAVLDDIDDNQSKVMLPRGVYIDMLYDYVITGSGNDYWTKTHGAFENENAWRVNKSGYLNTSSLNAVHGVRPVIKISK